MFNRLMPARTQAEDIPQMKVLCDFDALVEKSVGFKFNGKYHVLENVSVENYMEVSQAYSQLLEMTNSRSQGDPLTVDEVYSKYFDLVHPLAPSISVEELKKMAFVQLNQLMSLILRQVAGDPTIYETDQKKNPLNLIQS